ncbi:MAG: hypothetical protein ACOC5T_04190 [Elusimicrobiota bacterium]
MGKKNKRRKRDGLTSKVMGFYPHSDHQGKFIAYCDFSAHRGIVLRPRVCESRRCTHYYKTYLNQENREYENES